jgi:hypothetical protein
MMTNNTEVLKKADELDRLSARYRLLTDLKNAEDESDRNGWIEEEELEKELEAGRQSYEE